jgi:uncharacterized RDD family membrane protein YckC
MASAAIEHIHKDTQLQGHWARRLVAGTLDFIIILFPLVFVDAMFSIVLGPIGRYYSSVFLAGVVWFLYSTLLEGAASTTLGKKLVGLSVERTDGKGVTFAEAAVRNLSRIFGLFLILDLLIGFVTEGNHRQKLMDRVSGTVVVLEGG